YQWQKARYAWALLLWLDLFLRHFPAVVDHFDDCREILVAATPVDEALVQLLRLAAHRRIGAYVPGGFGGKLQVLEHQCRRESALIITIGRSLGPNARNRTVARHRPALSRGLR